MNGLTAHYNSNYVTEVEVMEVPRPEFTKSWHPYAHKDIITALNSAITLLDITVDRKQYAMNEKKTTMFGVWNLPEKINGAYPTIGFRNNISKEMPIGLTAGANVFVCDNLAFSGEWVQFRRHTGGLDEAELSLMVLQAINKTMVAVKLFAEWHESLKVVPLTNIKAKEITYDAMRKGIMPVTYFPKFNEMFFGDNKYGQNLYGWYNIQTELLKDVNIASWGQVRYENLTKFTKEERFFLP